MKVSSPSLVWTRLAVVVVGLSPTARAAGTVNDDDDDAWKVVGHKQAGYACNATGVTEQCGDLVCAGGVKMCLQATPVPTTHQALAALVATELQGQVQQLLVPQDPQDSFWLPSEESMEEWHDMEQTMKLATDNSLVEPFDKMERTMVFGGGAKMEFCCKVSYGMKNGTFYKMAHCSFKGEKKGAVKPDDGPEELPPQAGGATHKQLRSPEPLVMVDSVTPHHYKKYPAWKVVAHKHAGYSCNGTGVTEQWGDLVCAGGLQMCLHATPAVPPPHVANMVATQLQGQVAQLFGQDHNYLLPNQDALREWKHMEEEAVALEANQEGVVPQDDFDRTIVFGGGAKVQVHCKVSYGFDKKDKKFHKTIGCELKGEKKASVKPDPTQFDWNSIPSYKY